MEFTSSVFHRKCSSSSRVHLFVALAVLSAGKLEPREFSSWVGARQHILWTDYHSHLFESVCVGLPDPVFSAMWRGLAVVQQSGAHPPRSRPRSPDFLYCPRLLLASLLPWWNLCKWTNQSTPVWTPFVHMDLLHCLVVCAGLIIEHLFWWTQLFSFIVVIVV